MILVTGGAGYIGSHTCIELFEAGYDYVIIDNLHNSNIETIERLSSITGKEINFVKGDVRRRATLERIFQDYEIEAVIHFAGYKAVGESVSKPLSYYRNNIESTISLCEVMNKYKVKKLVFSSSATVYHKNNDMPVDENSVLGCSNPYGWTKYMIERILKDLYDSDKDWSILSLRYFNPIGAHKSGLIGEKPNGIPNNLMPYICMVAAQKLKKLHVYGNDYSTADGTGVRDYIHVSDLSKAHVSALKHLSVQKGTDAINVGTGKGYSVLEVIKTFEKVTRIPIPYDIQNRRAGDIAICYAQTEKAEKTIGWQAECGLDQMCIDAWKWASSYYAE